MAGESSVMSLEPIGIVSNDIKQPGQHDWTELVSEIIIDDRFVAALDGLEGFSHIIVLFWLHRSPAGDFPLKVHPMRRPELPLTGVFATRSPRRPNPVALTTVRLLGRQGNVLTVRGLDAIDGTPVIDIKPYIPNADAVAEPRIPRWLSNNSVS